MTTTSHENTISVTPFIVVTSVICLLESELTELTPALLDKQNKNN